MRILYLNHYAGSPLHGMEFRPFYLAREWVRGGHEVRILAGSQSHVRAVQPDLGAVSGAGPLLQTIEGVHYVWYATPAYQGNGLGRALNIWAFLRQVWAAAPAIAVQFKPDVVIASSTYPMDIWVARRIARRASARLVYEVHDLWPLSPIELGGMSPRHPFIMLCQAAENAAYHDADAVVSMLPNAQDHMAEHGLDLRKLHVVPNGVASEDWTGDTPPVAGPLADHVEWLRQQGRFVVGYTGSHGTPNSLDTLLDAAKLLRDEPVSFVLVGDGHLKANLRERVRSEQLEQVALFDPIPKRQIPALLRRFDAAYLGAPRSPIYRFGVCPNKMIDYMMAGVPVLYAIEAGNDPIAQAGCGVSLAAENPKALAAAIRQLRGLAPDRLADMGRAGQAYARDNHLYPALARQFLAAASGA